MKASLQLNLSQQLTLTPQLQQAIRLLQLSTIELQQEVQQALETNPLLEMEHSEETQSEQAPASPLENITADAVNYDLPKDLMIDSRSSSNSDADPQNFENFTSAVDTLRDYLVWQMELTPFSEIRIS